MGRMIDASWAQLAAGNGSADLDFYLVGQGYYSPATPSGDPHFFEGLKLAPALDFGPQGSQTAGLYNDDFAPEVSVVG